MKSFWNVLRVILGIALIVFAVVRFGLSINNSKVEKETEEQQKQVMVDTLKSGYDQLELGMTYDECVSILGAEGELFSESESEYAGKFEAYIWKPHEDALFIGIEAHFTDEKLTDKTWMEA